MSKSYKCGAYFWVKTETWGGVNNCLLKKRKNSYLTNDKSNPVLEVLCAHSHLYLSKLKVFFKEFAFYIINQKVLNEQLKQFEQKLIAKKRVIIIKIIKLDPSVELRRHEKGTIICWVVGEVDLNDNIIETTF